MSALELAERALRAAEGDEALALVQSERSGMARFAGSEVHQPTLVESTVVHLRIADGGKVGSAVTTRIGTSCRSIDLGSGQGMPEPITRPVNENGSGWPKTEVQAAPSVCWGDISSSR